MEDISDRQLILKLLQQNQEIIGQLVAQNGEILAQNRANQAIVNRILDQNQGVLETNGRLEQRLNSIERKLDSSGDPGSSGGRAAS